MDLGFPGYNESGSHRRFHPEAQLHILTCSTPGRSSLCSAFLLRYYHAGTCVSDQAARSLTGRSHSFSRRCGMLRVGYFTHDVGKLLHELLFIIPVVVGL
jgi:hypothetical protein